MAWNTLKYACGHSEQVQLYGKHTSRDAEIARAASRDCPACRAAKATASDAAAGLPALVGTEKQIAWASTERAALLVQADLFAAELAGYQAKLDTKEYPADTPAATVEASRIRIAANTAALAKLRAITKASWWIDNRGGNINAIIIELRK